ncbi:putative nucleotide-diphospho-sugar transferase [Butyrivibrio sp. AE3009]|uniref:putative nucleotide-diphospho-sugar transferase n=1 Tax=Butyrivibrio sp. AE3009 TaxID=1280666 RepID=UPI0003B7B48D|nr:putative nucleotide-diphospho-sugar transferase [Butyrivibrio sp. AE3009]
MRIVYVLVSDSEDIYYEECMISIKSIKTNKIDAEIFVVMDDDTFEGLIGKRSEIKKYAIIKHLPFESGVKKRIRSRVLKTSIRELIEGSFLYVDTDTVFCEKIEADSFRDIPDIGMVLDKHTSIDLYYNKQFYYKNAERLGFSVGYQGKHYNSGVFWVNDTAESRHFFKRWKELYLYSVKKKIFTDQTSLNEANFDFDGIITELPGEWNVQVDTGINYIHNAKIIHYVGYSPRHKHGDIRMSVPYGLCDYQLFMQYKETGLFSKELLEIINNPKSGFKNVYIIADDCAAYRVLGSYQFKVIRLLQIRARVLYEGIERILRLVIEPFI